MRDGGAPAPKRGAGASRRRLQSRRIACAIGTPGLARRSRRSGRNSHSVAVHPAEVPARPSARSRVPTLRAATQNGHAKRRTRRCHEDAPASRDVPSAPSPKDQLPCRDKSARRHRRSCRLPCDGHRTTSATSSRGHFLVGSPKQRGTPACSQRTPFGTTGIRLFDPGWQDFWARVSQRHSHRWRQHPPGYR